MENICNSIFVIQYIIFLFMKKNILLFVAILITASSFAQKITSKKIYQHFPTYPEIPISADGYDYSIKVVGDKTGNLTNIAIETLQIPNLTYKVEAENTYSFEFIDVKFSTQAKREGDSIIYNASFHNKLGVKLHNKTNNYFYFISYNPNYNEGGIKIEGEPTYIETTKDAKERIAFSINDASKYFTYYNSSGLYGVKPDFAKKSYTRLRPIQESLMLKKGCNELIRKHSFNRKGRQFEYLSIKKYYAEADFGKNLESYKRKFKEYYNIEYKKYSNSAFSVIKSFVKYDTFNLEELAAIKFWKEKLNDSDPWVIAVSAFNLSTAYAAQGDGPSAKKYYNLIKTGKGANVGEKKISKLNDFINSSSLLYNLYFNSKKEYIYANPLEISFVGNVSFSKGEVVLTTLEQESKKKEQAKAKVDDTALFNNVRVIDGVKGEVYLIKEGMLSGDLKVLFSIPPSDEDKYFVNKLNTVYVKILNKKGVLKYKGFNVAKVDYFVIDNDKYYALDIQPSGSITSGDPHATGIPMPRKLYHLEQVLETGTIYRDYSTPKMPYAIKLNHSDKVIIFEDYGKNDAIKRASKLLSKCKGMKNFEKTYNGEITLKGMVEILETHDSNCTVH